MDRIAICPRCGKQYDSRPAISRTDNTTEICPVCGTREALETFGYSGEQAKEIAEAIYEGQWVKI